MSRPDNLKTIVNRLLQPGKGILAADESTKSAITRLEACNIDSGEETRRLYRQLLVTAPGLSNYLSGIILYEETLFQKLDNGQTFAQYLHNQSIIPGIKVDKGLIELTNFTPETVTEGLDGLSERLKKYYEAGARFTKWRCAFQVAPAQHLPSQIALHTNLEIMARYAAIAQANNMVPIVEPEVLYDGDYDIDTCKEVLSQVLRILFDMLHVYHVELETAILKTSMVMAGKQFRHQSTDRDVAQATIEVFRDRVPRELAGIVFLSGGQTPDQATSNLAAICKTPQLDWPTTFSFSRAIQDPVMTNWSGKEQNILTAQTILTKRLADNALAVSPNKKS